KRFELAVINRFEQYDWPGNIREMENLIERLIVTIDGEEITLDDLPDSFLDIEKNATSKTTLKCMVQREEKKEIKNAIQEHRTTKKAAESLGISQSTLVKKMQRLNIGETNDYFLNR